MGTGAVFLIFFAAIGLIITLIAFVALSRTRRSLLPIEKGKTPLYNGFGGYIFPGAWHVPASMARITLYEEFIVIGVFNRFLIRYKDIINLGTEKRAVGVTLKLVYMDGHEVRTIFLCGMELQGIKKIILNRVDPNIIFNE